MKMRKQQEITAKFELFSFKIETSAFFLALTAHFFNKNIKWLLNSHCLRDFLIRTGCFNRFLFKSRGLQLSIAYSTAHNHNLLYQSTKI